MEPKNESSNTKPPPNGEGRIRLRPVTVAVMVLLWVTNAVVANSLDTTVYGEAILVGLLFGQVGASLLWYFTEGQHSWMRLIVMLGVAAVASCVLASSLLDSNFNLADIAAMAVIVYTFAALAFAGCMTLAWFYTKLPRREDASANLSTPRFGVKHLLVLTTLLAIASLVVRLALPELGTIDYDTVIFWNLQSAFVTTVAYALSQQRTAVFFRVAALVLVALAGTAIMSFTSDWNVAVYANAVQVAILTIAMAVMRVDRQRDRTEIATSEQHASTDGTNA